jgi:hypothetical protein
MRVVAISDIVRRIVADEDKELTEGCNRAENSPCRFRV